MDLDSALHAAIAALPPTSSVGSMLKELNALNRTNLCMACQKNILINADRNYCTIEQWNRVSAKRTPDVVGCYDILLRSGLIHRSDQLQINRTYEAANNIYQDQCTCRYGWKWKKTKPFIVLDPRCDIDYEERTGYEKLRATIGYTELMIRNLHSLYHFDDITNPNHLLCSLADPCVYRETFIMDDFRQQYPNRYGFVMNLMSLFVFQREFYGPMIWLGWGFLESHKNPCEEEFQDMVEKALFQFCMPPTDATIVRFVRTMCYPSKKVTGVLGPALLNRVSIFSPFFDMVPLSENDPVNLPDSLEVVDNINIFVTTSRGSKRRR